MIKRRTRTGVIDHVVDHHELAPVALGANPEVRWASCSDVSMYSLIYEYILPDVNGYTDSPTY